MIRSTAATAAWSAMRRPMAWRAAAPEFAGAPATMVSSSVASCASTHKKTLGIAASVGMLATMGKRVRRVNVSRNARAPKRIAGARASASIRILRTVETAGLPAQCPSMARPNAAPRAARPIAAPATPLAVILASSSTATARTAELAARFAARLTMAPSAAPARTASPRAIRATAFAAALASI
jgi:hypothetical protein